MEYKRSNYLGHLYGMLGFSHLDLEKTHVHLLAIYVIYLKLHELDLTEVVA